MLPHFIGRADNKLVPCALSKTPPSRELWLITRRQDARVPAIRSITDFLTQVFDNDRALFEER